MIDLSSYAADKKTPLYLFLRTTNSGGEQKTKLDVGYTPYENGSFRDGLPVFLNAYTSSNTNSIWGTISASSGTASTAYYLYDNNDKHIHTSTAGTNTITYTHTFNDVVTPDVTVTSSFNDNNTLIDGRFSLTSSQVSVGSIVLNKITSGDYTYHAMYEVVDIDNLNNASGYKQVDAFNEELPYGIVGCQIYLNTSNIPTSMKLVATVKTIDTEEFNIGTSDSDAVALNVTYAEYAEVTVFEINDFKYSGTYWVSPLILNTASSVVSYKLILTNENGTQVSIRKFIPYIATKFYSIPSDTTSGDNNDFQLGRLDLDGIYKFSGTVLGTNVTIPLLGVSSDNLTYTINNPFNTTLVECTLIDYLGNNNYKEVDDVTSTSITNEKITIQTATAPTGFHCLRIKRMW